MLSIGDTAPDFELPTQNGETVSLSDFSGDRVVIYFYPKANTPGCTTEACGFRDAYDEFRSQDIHVVGISTDSVEELQKFEAENDLPFTLLSDETGEVADAYNTFAEKEVKGDMYEIATRDTYVVGPDGKIERTYEGVSPEGHAEEILADLDGN